jgi:hypothetical protein
MAKTEQERLNDLLALANSVVAEINEVVGNLTDKSFSDSSTTPTVIGHLKANYYHVHDSAKVYPTGADPITVTTSNAGGGHEWEHGTKVQIIPANTITTKFDIHWVLISAISATDDYELKLWKGAEGVETLVATIAFVRNSNFSQEGNMPIQVSPIAANTRIAASIACGDSDGATAAVKLYYHAYPDIT